MTQLPSIFTDSVSALHGNSSGVDICGDRYYSILSSPTAAVSALNNSESFINPYDGTIYLYTENRDTVGTHTAIVSVGLANYLLVTAASQTFDITIEPCKISSYKANNPTA